MNFDLFRKNVKWAGLSVLIHLGAMLLFGMVFSPTLEKLEEDGAIASAHQSALWCSVLLFSIFSLFFFKISSTFADYKRELKEAMKEDGFSLIGYYKKHFFREDAWKMAIFAAFQIPFMIFFAVAGVSYLYSTSIDMFYVLEAGFYGVCGNPFLGLLLCSVTFSVIFFLFRFIFLALTARSIKKL